MPPAPSSPLLLRLPCCAPPALCCATGVIQIQARLHRGFVGLRLASRGPSEGGKWGGGAHRARDQLNARRRGRAACLRDTLSCATKKKHQQWRIAATRTTAGATMTGRGAAMSVSVTTTTRTVAAPPPPPVVTAVGSSLASRCAGMRRDSASSSPTMARRTCSATRRASWTDACARSPHRTLSFSPHGREHRVWILSTLAPQCLGLVASIGNICC
jgi:hypothetical protein